MIRTMSVTSGKGGVGKTTLISNLALSLAKNGKRVLIFDGDLGMANVDILFGTKSKGSIWDVINAEKDIADILTPLAPNIDLIPGGTGVAELNRLNPFQRRALIESLSPLEYKYDYLLIDTAPGLSENVLYLNSAAQMITMIITPDAASITDAYALMKILHTEYKEQRFTVVCNQVRDEFEGLSLYKRFNEVVGRFLNVSLDYAGSIPSDAAVRRSTQTQKVLLNYDPQSQAGLAIQGLSQKMEKSLTARNSEKAGMQFFIEQVVSF
jgi:flagellar biosynthesis protein FlhG